MPSHSEDSEVVGDSWKKHVTSMLSYPTLLLDEAEMIDAHWREVLGSRKACE